MANQPYQPPTRLPQSPISPMLRSMKRNPSTQLALNGTPVFMHNILMTVSVKREEKDMSGQKSSTKKTDKGVKAKELQVTGFIPYTEKDWLKTLFELAEAEDSKGEQVKYRVACVSAETVNMREVQFSDTVQAAEQQGQLGWAVSFTLKEVNSVAEKKDQRRKKPKVKTQGEKALAAQTPQSAKNTAENTPKQEDIRGTDKDDSFWGKVNNAIGD